MKKILVLASLFVAASMISCEKSESADVNGEDKVVKVIAYAAGYDETRTTFEKGEDSYAVKWVSGDQLKLGYGKNNGNQGHSTDAVNVNIDKTDASIGSFWLQFNNNRDQAVALYPLSASLAGTGGPSHRFQASHVYFNIPSEQNAGVNTPDPASSIMYGLINDGGSTEKMGSCKFNHVMAYGRMTFSNWADDVAGAKITSVKLTVNDADAKVTGTTYAYDWSNKVIETDKDNESEYWVAGAAIAATVVKNFVTVNIEGGVDCNDGEVWFAVVPTYGEAYNNLTIEVTLDNGSTYTKTNTSANLVLNEGKVRPINVDMSGATK